MRATNLVRGSDREHAHDLGSEAGVSRGAGPVAPGETRAASRSARRLLLTFGMNEIALGVKRAHHGFLRITRRRLASVGLTAARFDMLYAVRKHGWAFRREDRVKILQSDLRRALGVTATVVSRMVRALETLGLVVRHRDTYGDRRQILVTLTKRGLEALERAGRLLLKGVQHIVYKVICYGDHRDPHARFVAMETLESYLHALRQRFRDTATLYYHWGHPDD